MMYEKTNPANILITRRKRLKKKRLLPMSPQRKKYEEEHIAFGCRIPRDLYFKFLSDAKVLGLTQKEYLSRLIDKSNISFESAKAAAFDEGVKLGEARGYEKGLKHGAAADVDKIRAATMREMEQRLGVDFPCIECGNPIIIERGTPYHEIAARACFREGFICPHCHLEQKMRKYEEKQIVYKPSFFPEGY